MDCRAAIGMLVALERPEVNMDNPFKQLKSAAKAHDLSVDELIHSLMACVYLECCTNCIDRLHSEAFLETFDHMAAEMKLCKALGCRNAA